MKYVIIGIMLVLMLASVTLVSAKKEEKYFLALYNGEGGPNGEKGIWVTKAEFDIYRRAEKSGHTVGVKFIENLRASTAAPGSSAVQKTVYTPSAYASKEQPSGMNGRKLTIFQKAKLVQKQQASPLAYAPVSSHASDLELAEKSAAESTIWFTIQNTFERPLFVTGYVLETIPAVTGFAINGNMPTEKIQVKTGAWADRIECVGLSNKLVKPAMSARCGYTFANRWLVRGTNEFSFNYGTTQSDKGVRETYTFS